MASAPTYAELAVAIAYVLQKWKDAGASEAEIAQFDDLLLRAAAEPQAEPLPPAIPMPPIPMHKARADEPRRSQRLPMSDKLRALDAEIDAVNREVED